VLSPGDFRARMGCRGGFSPCGTLSSTERTCTTRAAPIHTTTRIKQPTPIDLVRKAKTLDFGTTVSLPGRNEAGQKTFFRGVLK
jgi:hypothetical protein